MPAHCGVPALVPPATLTPSGLVSGGGIAVYVVMKPAERMKYAL